MFPLNQHVDLSFESINEHHRSVLLLRRKRYLLLSDTIEDAEYEEIPNTIEPWIRN